MARLNVEHEKEYDLLRNTCGVFAEPGAALIELRGEDHLSWLQGQVTNDLRDLQAGGSIACCVLEPTGQILAVCRVWSLFDKLLISTEADCSEPVMRRIEQMVILEDVVARELSTDLRLWSVQGRSATEYLSSLSSLPTLDAGNFNPVATSSSSPSGGLALRNDRTGYGGWDIWLPSKPFELPEIGPEVYEIARLEAGIPKWGQDIKPKALPNELGTNFIEQHVSFTKGCYTGQEVVMRIHSRGHTNRTWVGLKAHFPMQAGNTLSHSSRQDAGVVTSAVVSPRFGPIAAAMIRNEALHGPVTVVTESGPIATKVVELPFIAGA